MRKRLAVTNDRLLMRVVFRRDNARVSRANKLAHGTLQHGRLA